MALGIVSDKDFETDLKNSQAKTTPKEDQPEESIDPAEILESDNKFVERVVSGEIILPVKLGRNGSKATPDILQKLIGEEYAIAGRVEGNALAESLGISPSSASAYANGATSTASYDKKKNSIENFIKGRKNRIIKKASAKVLAAIEGIDEDKLAEAPAGVLAGIARNLSGVIRDLEPPVKIDDRTTNVQFVMYAPRLIPEASLEVITIQE